MTTTFPVASELFAAHLLHLRQTALEGSFQPDAFAERTQELLGSLTPGSEEAHRFSGALSHLDDLVGDDRFHREEVLDTIGRLERGEYTALVPGHSYFDLLARGGEASVYRAFQRSDDSGRIVALKVAHTAGAVSPQTRERRIERLRENFRAEWDVLDRLDSEFVLKAYGLGETESGKPYLALEYMDVGALSVYVRRRIKAHRDRTTAFPMEERLGIAIRMAAALAVFHENDLLHNDVKLGNYLIDRHGEIKLGDPSRPDIVRGTPGHLSVQTKPSAKGDVFALGVALYILFTGKIPFDSSQLYMTLFTPPPPSTVNPEVPRAVDRVVMKAIARAPATRTSDAMALLDALERISI